MARRTMAGSSRRPPAPGEKGVVVTFMGTTTALISDGETSLLTDGYFSRVKMDTDAEGGGVVEPDMAAIKAGIAALGTMSKSVKAVIGEEEWKGKTISAAEQVGKMLGAACVEKGITQAVFDRGGFLYHGRVRAIAEGAREAGVSI